MINLKSIFINGYANFENTKILFEDSANFLIGPNGVGKTRLLDLLRDILQSADSNIGTPQSYYLNLPKGSEVLLEFQAETLTSKTINKFFFDVYAISGKYLNYEEVKGKILVSEIIETSSDKTNVSHFIGKKATIFFAKVEQYEYSGSRFSTFLWTEESLYRLWNTDNAIFNEIFADRTLVFSREANYKYESYISKFKQAIESKPIFTNYFDDFQKKTTSTFNKLSGTDELSFEYSSKPETHITIKNQEGKTIDSLSSGEEQLERLKIFSCAVKELRPKFVIMDEPELHLNYAQLSKLYSILCEIEDLGAQVFVATHSTFFIRTTHFSKIKYLKFNSNKKCVHVPIERSIKRVQQYPDLFFSQKVILVESSADAIFYQRTFDVIYRSKKLKELSLLNINFVPVGGKSSFNSICSFLSKFLKLKFIVISDLDFLLNIKDYNYIDQKDREFISKSLKDKIKMDYKKTSKRFKQLSGSDIDSFILVLERIFKDQSVSIKDVQLFESIKGKIFHYTYEENKLLKYLGFDSIQKKLSENNTFILKRGKLEDYVSRALIENNKVSIDKLNEGFFPESLVDLKEYIPEDKIKDIIEIAELLYTRLSE